MDFRRTTAQMAEAKAWIARAFFHTQRAGINHSMKKMLSLVFGMNASTNKVEARHQAGSEKKSAFDENWSSSWLRPKRN